MRKLLPIAICFLFTLLPQQIFSAALIVSPGQSIQTAVNTAASGDVITVNAGNYSGKTTVSKSNLTIQANGKAVTKHINVSGNNNTIKGFTISDATANSGIMVTGNNNLFENNEIYHTKQDGIWFFGIGNTFRGNYVHDILDPSVCGSDLYTTSCDPHVDCFQTWGSSWETRDILFEGNFCRHNRSMGSNQSVMFENQSNNIIQNITFRNNIFVMHDAGYTIMNFHRKSGQKEIKNIHVLNNTFYNTTLRGQEAIKFSGITGGRIANNVSIGFSAVTNATNGSTPIIANNLKSDGAGMVNYQRFDFHLIAGSPLINAGADVAVTTDYDGNARDDKPDIGAHEYGGSSLSPTPSDLNGDEVVNLFDYNLVVSGFGNPYTIFDYNTLVAQYGK